MLQDQNGGEQRFPNPRKGDQHPGLATSLAGSSAKSKCGPQPGSESVSFPHVQHPLEEEKVFFNPLRVLAGSET